MAEFKYLELRYFVSHDVHVDVQCDVNRLELPTNPEGESVNAGVVGPWQYRSLLLSCGTT